MSPRGKKWFKGTLLGIGAFTSLFMILFPYWARKTIRPATEQDREGATLQKGVAQIAVYVPARSEEVANRYYAARVLVRFRGKLLEPRNVLQAETLRENQTVEIEYRVGKSGRTYLDTVRPLSRSLGIEKGLSP